MRVNLLVVAMGLLGMVAGQASAGHGGHGRGDHGVLAEDMAAVESSAQEGRTRKDRSRGFPGKRLHRHGLNGDEAVEALGADLDKVAAWYGYAPDSLRRALKRDRKMRLNAEGRLLYVEEIDQEEAAEMDLAYRQWAAEMEQGAILEGGAVSGGAVPSGAFAGAADAFALHSRPGAKRVIYLDFTGGPNVTGTGWNSYFGVASIPVAPFDQDGNPGAFSDAERTAIYQVWQRVAEDYAPFEVDVTTEKPTAAQLTRTSASDDTFGVRVAITKDWTAASASPCNCGGIAFVGSFDDTTENYKPAWVFYTQLGGGYEKYVAEAASHEAGHTLGLSHDGSASTGYYLGHGSGNVGWAPIMGAGYYKNLTQWSKGEYAGANQKQDDLALIQQYGLPLRADDAGNDTANAATLTGSLASSTQYGTGLIGTSTDKAVFRLALGAGMLSVDVRPAERGANLDVLLEVLDASGNVIQSSNPEDDLAAYTDPMQVTAGTYYLRVSGAGLGDPAGTGYTRYGSLGQYAIAATLEPFQSQAPTAKATASVTTGTVPFTVNFTGTGADPEGKPVTYAWTLLESTGASRMVAGPTASMTYTAAGKYLAVLRVTDADGMEATDSVVVDARGPALPPPTVSVSASPALGYAPFNALLIGTAKAAPGGSIKAVSWNFGDGGADTAQGNVRHLYAQPGTYTVRYSVTDSADNTVYRTTTVKVLAPRPPTLSVSVPRTTAYAPANLQFYGRATTAPGVTVKTATWDFGDGATAAGINQWVYHTYSKAGTYTVRYTVTDSVGGVTTKPVRVTVREAPPPAVRVTSQVTGSRTVPVRVAFLATASTLLPNKALTYSWDFGSYGTASTASPSVTFTEPGVYPVVVTVTDASGRSTTASTVIVASAPPAPRASIPSVSAAKSGSPVSLAGWGYTKSGKALTYAWDFGDGQSASTLFATHSYADPGTYTVKLTVTDAYGQSTTATRKVTVGPAQASQPKKRK